MNTNRVSGIIDNLNCHGDLNDLIAHRPLAMLPFDCKYRLLDFQLSNVINANIQALFLLMNQDDMQSVFDHINGGKEWGLDSLRNKFIMHFNKKNQEGEYEQGFISHIVDYLRKSSSEITVIMGSKMLCNIDLKAIIKIHKHSNRDMTVVYKRVTSENISCDNLLIDLQSDGNISLSNNCKEKLEPNEKYNLCMDIFIVRTEWLIKVLENYDEKAESIIKILREKINTISCMNYEYTGYLSNIYDIQSYYRANMDMLKSSKFNSLLYSNQKIYTKLANEVPTYYAQNSIVNNSHFASGSIVDGTVVDSLIARRCKISESAIIEQSIIMASANIKKNAYIKNAILDKNVIVDEGVRIIGSDTNPIIIKKDSHVKNDIVNRRNL
ncbi:glucose-1-phosphate adenylyltransferase subunit GlgD [Clostridium saccharoperbutylacetonicum]|uniref:glucose-1-phosphate adenylyltransferase subunit GlgD n=1 Tax=Clostridium saccharoperbutylacetonicum TaxID=36745 RepID=UPI000983C9FD|nr:glucose-1-phosphate adenylyltransferase subunit GlgD [Clostridium saccharoperbutylacetonicum]AQR97267.1 glycogen biosynthesis protein GlgD [Clostridium saccharoperbutylacetonicum]NSB33149.1 glucose-1-phosphate adenylyltransferase [Clostridium saccharoperbutylacetonicum]